jgi:hypothetical protein
LRIVDIASWLFHDDYYIQKLTAYPSKWFPFLYGQRFSKIKSQDATDATTLTENIPD